MRELTPDEINEALDDNGESEDGCIAIEATVNELADLEVGTVCGSVPNQCFKVLQEKGFGKKLCRGWYNERTPIFNHDTKTFDSTFRRSVYGMFHIQITSEKIARRISNLAYEGGGSLRDSGESLWKGFWEFEIE